MSIMSFCLSIAFLCNKQPKHDHQGHKQEEAGQELLIHVLGGPGSRWWGPSIIDVKSCGKNTKWEGSDAKGHLESTVSEPKTLESSPVLRLRSLSLRPRRSSLSGVLLPRAAPAVQGNDFVTADASLADRTHLSVWSRLQPLMQTGPTEQVPAQTDHSVLGRVQADVTLEGAILVPTLP